MRDEHIYGQGSSREHAALCPMYLGVRAVLARSFARIHRDNLANFGILALDFLDPADYDRVGEEDELEIAEMRQTIALGRDIVVRNKIGGTDMPARRAMTPRMIQIYLHGGLLNYVKAQAKVR